MSANIKTLIDLIEQFPHLWDKKVPQYKDKIATENAWISISRIMELSIEECQDAWNTIRLKYLKERKIITGLPSGSGAYSCKWPYYDRCGFLATAIAMRKTKGNLVKKLQNTTKSASDVWSSVETMIAEVPLEKLVATCSSLGSTLDGYLHRSSSVESSLPQEDLHFALSLAETLSKLKNEKEKLLIKANILVMVAEKGFEKS